MRTLYLVSKRLPRVCMDGSQTSTLAKATTTSAPRVHGWFLMPTPISVTSTVCPACAWMVPPASTITGYRISLPRVCMDGSST